jgi:hypothetical protein
MARADSREQRRREHGDRHARVYGGIDRPTALAGVRDFADETVEAGLRASAALVRSSSHERTTLPWRHSSAIAARSKS